MRYNFLDLFHGIGGFALGARMAGLEIDKHYCSDVKPSALRVYAKNFPEAVQLGDICAIDGTWVKEVKTEAAWIITGGFP